MRHTNLIAGYDVDYSEESNTWALVESSKDSNKVHSAGSLKELRAWAAKQEKVEKETFKRFEAYHSERYGLSKAPILVTVTSYDGYQAWVSYTDDLGRAKRAKVQRSNLHPVTPETSNLVRLIENAEKNIAERHEFIKSHLADLSKLTYALPN